MVEDGVAGVGGFHVLGGEGDGDVEVQIEGEDSAGDEDNEDCESGVFEVCDLDFHWAELDAPASVFVGWRRFKPNVLPVC